MRTLFVNGSIHTNTEDKPRWVAIEGGTIAGVHPSEDFVDEDPHGIENWKSDDLPDADRVIDLQGGALVPAFRDAHVHLPATGLYRAGMDFRGEKSAARILDAYRKQVSSGALLFGGNFEEPLDAPLTAADLDTAVGDRPAVLVRADMHSVIASSGLMRELDVRGLEGVDVDDDGRPTGFLREQAASEAYKWFDLNLPKQQQIDAIRSAVELAYSKGIVSVHEMHVVEWRGWDAWTTLTEAVADLALTVVPYIATDDVDRVQDLGFHRIGGDWFLDGSFGSHTAWMKEPFTSAPPAGSPPNGISYRDDEALFELFLAAQEADLQMAVHAIGDAAIEQAITTWERVAAKVGVDQVRRKLHRIEHFECAGDDHIRRAAALGLAASVQPAFDHLWGGPEGLYSERIGWGRARLMNRFGSMTKAGIRLAAGSDSTVTPLDPFLQMHSLRNHHLAEERLSPETALFMHTAAPEMLVGRDPNRGTIETGCAADLVWLDRDPITASGKDLLETEVLGTWANGKRVWPQTEAEAV